MDVERIVADAELYLLGVERDIGRGRGVGAARIMGEGERRHAVLAVDDRGRLDVEIGQRHDLGTRAGAGLLVGGGKNDDVVEAHAAARHRVLDQ